MYAPRQIVVPIDFSEPSRAATRRAGMLSETFGVPLHLVHAVQYPVGSVYTEFPVPAASWESIRADAGKYLEERRVELEERGIEVTAQLSELDPVAAIGSSVEEHSANLVVMGTHGYGGLKHLFLGSVAERTLRTIDCPVLAVKGPEAEASEPIRKILCATDFSIHSRQAARVARGLAAKLGASVDVIHVIVPPTAIAAPYGGPILPSTTDLVTDLMQRAQALIDPVVDEFRDAGIQAARHIHHGMPAQTIADEAGRLDADLIVMGTRGNTGLKHVVLGSVAERILRLAPCSVLSVKDGDSE